MTKKKKSDQPGRPNLTLYVPDELLFMFKNYCEMNNVSMNSTLIKFMKNYIITNREDIEKRSKKFYAMVKKDLKEKQLERENSNYNVNDFDYYNYTMNEEGQLILKENNNEKEEE